MASFVILQDVIVNVDEIKFISKVDITTYNSPQAYFTIYFQKDIYTNFCFFPRDYGFEAVSEEGFLTKIRNIRNSVVQRHNTLYKIDEGINLKKENVSP